MKANAKRLLSICIMVTMLFTLVIPAFADSPGDISGHWAADEINKWVEKGIIKGYDDGSFRPNDTITRAEFTAFLARIFNFISKSDKKFPDVSDAAWYAETVSMSVEAGIIKGDDSGNFRPNDPISRQEAAVILYRIFDLKVADKDAAGAFADCSSIPAWSRDAISALFESKYVKGRPDNTFAPLDNMNRAEAVKMIDSIAGDLRNIEGTYTGDITGNLVVNTSGITLEDMNISGDLYLAHGIGEGEVSLVNVNIDGRVIVRGGGENSITLDNTSIAGTLVIIKQNGKIRIVVKGSSDIPNVQVSSEATLLEEDLTGEGIGKIEVMELEPGKTITLDGDFDVVDVVAPGVKINVENGKVNKLNVLESAIDSKIIVSSGSIGDLTVAASSSIEGKGSIGNATINSKDVKMEQKPSKIIVAEGITAEVAGQPVTGTVVVTPPFVPTTPAPTVGVTAIKVGYSEDNGLTWADTASCQSGGVITDLAGLADTALIRDITINATQGGTIKLTSLTDNSGAGLVIPNILATPQTLPTASITDMVGSNLLGGDGVSLKNLRALFGGSVKITGVLSASNGAQLTVSFTLNLPQTPEETAVNEFVSFTKEGSIVYADIKAGKGDTSLQSIGVYTILSESGFMPHKVIVKKGATEKEFECTPANKADIIDAIYTDWYSLEDGTLSKLKSYMNTENISIDVYRTGDVNETPYTLKFKA